MGVFAGLGRDCSRLSDSLHFITGSLIYSLHRRSHSYVRGSEGFSLVKPGVLPLWAPSQGNLGCAEDPVCLRKPKGVGDGLWGRKEPPAPRCKALFLDNRWHCCCFFCCCSSISERFGGGMIPDFPCTTAGSDRED